MIEKVSDENRVKGFLIGMFGMATYGMGTELILMNDLTAIWFCALGLFNINLSFYHLLKEGE